MKHRVTPQHGMARRHKEDGRTFLATYGLTLAGGVVIGHESIVVPAEVRSYINARDRKLAAAKTKRARRGAARLARRAELERRLEVSNG